MHPPNTLQMVKYDCGNYVNRFLALLVPDISLLFQNPFIVGFISSSLSSRGFISSSLSNRGFNPRFQAN